MNKIILILDLDGVLITTPSWKADEIDSDGYSVFNQKCVDNLNKLLSKTTFEIWLRDRELITVLFEGIKNLIFTRHF